MSAYVVMFPGQGAQSVGMGASLWERFPEVCAAAEGALGYDLRRLCMEDDGRRLQRTEMTQPALYVVNYMHFCAYLQDGGGKPAFLLGHSLGEFNALQAAGVFDFQTGLRIVQKRGELMASVSDTGMAAVLGADESETQRILSEAFDDLDIANINTPSQTVIAGPLSTLDRAGDRFEEEGYGFVPLKVSCGFHSRYMQPQKAVFRRFLETFAFSPAATPVIANVTARPYPSEPAALLDTLAGQMDSPVRWKDSIIYLRDQGSFEFIEAGPGKVLQNLLGRIS